VSIRCVMLDIDPIGSKAVGYNPLILGSCGTTVVDTAWGKVGFIIQVGWRILISFVGEGPPVPLY